MPMIDIPAHVQHESFVQNQIQVEGGSNWDLSRSAIETPIARLPDPRPEGYQAEHKMPDTPAALSVVYAKGSTVLSRQALKELKELPAKSTVIVAGHADSTEKNPTKLAQRRAASVAAQLKKRGHKVEAVRSFADEVPVTFDKESSVLNRRVEVFKR